MVLKYYLKQKITTMRILSILLTLCLSVLVLNVDAQCVNGTKSLPIYKQGEPIIQEFDDLGMEVVKVEYDLIFDNKLSYRYLSDSWKYKVIAFADAGVKDLDIYLWEFDKATEEWIKVAEDTGDNAEPFVFHVPKEYTEYSVEIVVDEFYEGYTAARYGLIIVHE